MNGERKCLICTGGAAVLCAVAAVCIYAVVRRKKNKEQFVRVRYIYSKTFAEED